MASKRRRKKPTDAELLEFRREAKVWAVKKRRLWDACLRASDRQADALRAAIAAGVPLTTLAKDAGVSREMIYKVIGREREAAS